MMRLSLLAFLLVASLAGTAQQPSATPDWNPLDFLVGDWIGKGGGGPGQGSGSFSFHFDLEKHVLVRRNIADYPAANDRPAYHHEDLMVIYREDQSHDLLADYFDTEGHVIRYQVQPNEPSNTAVFIIDASTNGSRFRLTYKKVAEGLQGAFEIAPPGKPEEFKLYLQWTAVAK